MNMLADLYSKCLLHQECNFFRLKSQYLQLIWEYELAEFLKRKKREEVFLITLAFCCVGTQ